MNTNHRDVRVALTIAALLIAFTARAEAPAQHPEQPGRFESLIILDPTSSIDVVATPPSSLPQGQAARAGWEQFQSTYGQAWSVHLDPRSGAPLLVAGQGIKWKVGPGDTVDTLAASLRTFMAANRTLLLADDAELVLNKDASGLLKEDVWQIAFDRVVSGIPVDGERYLFIIGHGNLIAFGTPRWSRIDADPFPELESAEAQERLASYMKLTGDDSFELASKPELRFIALRPEGYTGATGAGYDSALVWRISVAVNGVPGTWQGLIDAHTGAIRSFDDTDDDAHVKGGVNPLSNDGICPNGCEQPNFPVPYTYVLSYQPTQIATSAGQFDCSPVGAQPGTKLTSKYVRVGSTCGLFVEQTTCDADINFKTNFGVDCAVPSGTSPGNTRAMRNAYYHLSRINEKARGWLPEVAWLNSQLQVAVDLTGNCLGKYNDLAGGLDFGRYGFPCRNSGENPGILYHEWGHGLDRFDGGGQDNPDEAYGDITSMLQTHDSCMGRGIFIQNPNCTGYGNACLSCSGYRDLDWDKHALHTPSTPTGFVLPRCSQGPAPCGRDKYCEGLLGGETVWDLATRDLPASGMDQATSWELVDKLWYVSRFGSGGNAWTCSPVTGASNGCAITAWFLKMRVVDDDDGNLANGTPHAAAIFAAYNRHAIACDTAASPSNQNSSICPPSGHTVLSATPGNAHAALSWTAVPNAIAYDVQRSDISCQAGAVKAARVQGTSYDDTGLLNGHAQYYRVRALLSNDACDGPLSICQSLTPQPFAGFVKVDADSYRCDATMTVTVTDANIGAVSTTVNVASNTETVPELVVLYQIAPGSATYTGTINLTSAPPGADGVLSVTHGDTITTTYIDASDGGGGINIPRVWTASVDCVVPVISKVAASNVTGTSAMITWSTNELATSVAHSGVTPPPGDTTSVPATVLGHGVELLGLTECTPYVYSVDSTDVVGNVATDNASGAYYHFTTGKSTQPSYVATDVPLDIPDNNPIGATSTITVPDARMVQDVNVTIQVEHTFDSDLTFQLFPPTGPPIQLANSHGDRDDNYTDTVFDDQATQTLNDGSAPYTGAFKPDSPLATANGINSLGPWKFKAVDHVGQDVGAVGTVLGWTLQLTYATPTCGPHAIFRSEARVADTCGIGGAGQNNTHWDAGENVQFKLTLANDGTQTLSGVTATVTPTTPGVAMIEGTASFPDIAPAATADSLAPHVTVHLPTSLACGDSVGFQVAIQSDQGSFSGPSFVQAIGHPTGGTGRVLDETFADGIPATWSIVDSGFGGGLASTWTAGNPGVRTIAAPMLLPVATVDSDASGPSAIQDESLLTPVLDLSTATTATLQFDEFFSWYLGNADEFADVDVRSSLTGGAWVNVLHQHGASSANPAHMTLDISASAAGAADAQVRFRDWNGANELFWQVDNVTIDTAAPGSCDMPVCALPTPGGAKPVADGTFGIAMKGSRMDPAGTSIAVTWDIATCASADQHILYGDLPNVASLTPTGAACDLGTTGSATWSGVPAGSLWFVVVGDDNAVTEGSWGTDGNTPQRGGTTPSGFCGLTVRDNSGVCP